MGWVPEPNLRLFNKRCKISITSARGKSNAGIMPNPKRAANHPNIVGIPAAPKEATLVINPIAAGTICGDTLEGISHIIIGKIAARDKPINGKLNNCWGNNHQASTLITNKVKDKSSARVAPRYFTARPVNSLPIVSPNQ